MLTPRVAYLPDSAIHCLRDLKSKPDGIPACEINAGIINRLINDNLAASVEKPSLRKSDHRRAIGWMIITDNGRHELAARGL